MAQAVDGRELPIVSLGLWLGDGRVDPDEVTEAVGLKPTIAQRADPTSRISARRRHKWGIRVGPREELAVEPLLADLKGLLDPSWERLIAKSETERLAPVVYCVVQLKSTLVPALEVSPDHLRWLAALGAIFDIDVMVRDPSESVGSAVS